MKEVVITPNYEKTAEFFARGLVTHSFDNGAKGPIISFIQQIRYLSQTDPSAVQRILDRLEK